MNFTEALLQTVVQAVCGSLTVPVHDPQTNTVRTQALRCAALLHANAC